MRSRRDFQEARRTASPAKRRGTTTPTRLASERSTLTGPSLRTASSETLGNGTYLNDCQVSEETHVSVCAAVMDGKAVGVTVATSPPDPEKERCVSGRVRTLEFPSNPRLRVVRTSF